jgi:hypothetical protein
MRTAHRDAAEVIKCSLGSPSPGEPFVACAPRAPAVGSALPITIWNQAVSNSSPKTMRSSQSRCSCCPSGREEVALPGVPFDNISDD